MPKHMNRSGLVILLHGILASSVVMRGLARFLEREGFETLCVSYPSTKMALQDLAIWVNEYLAREVPGFAERDVYFVTHSMGGLVFHHWHATFSPANVKRAVLLAPPLRGSEYAEGLTKLGLFRWILGPSGEQLNPNSNISAITYEAGVIAGTRSHNPISALFFRSQPNDGCVTVRSTKVPGLTAHKEVPVAHPFLMNNRTVRADVVAFLREGKFRQFEPL